MTTVLKTLEYVLLDTEALLRDKNEILCRRLFRSGFFKKIRNPILREHFEKFDRDRLIANRLALLEEFWLAIQEINERKTKRLKPADAVSIYHGYKNYKNVVGRYALDFPYICLTGNQSIQSEIHVLSFCEAWTDFKKARDFFVLGKFDIAKILSTLPIAAALRFDKYAQLPLLPEYGFCQPIVPKAILSKGISEADVSILFDHGYSTNRRKGRIAFSLPAVSRVPVKGRVNKNLEGLEFQYRLQNSDGLSRDDVIAYLKRYSSWWQKNGGKLDELRGWLVKICREAFVHANENNKYSRHIEKLAIPWADFDLLSRPPAWVEARANKIKGLIKLKEGEKRQREIERLNLESKNILVLKTWCVEYMTKVSQKEGDEDAETLYKCAGSPVLEVDGLKVFTIENREQLKEAAAALKNCSYSQQRRGRMITDELRTVVGKKGDEFVAMAEISRCGIKAPAFTRRVGKPETTVKLKDVKMEEFAYELGGEARKIQVPVFGITGNSNLTGRSLSSLFAFVAQCWPYSDPEKDGNPINVYSSHYFTRDEYDFLVNELGQKAIEALLDIVFYLVSAAFFRETYSQQSGVNNCRLEEGIKATLEDYRTKHLTGDRITFPEPAPVNWKEIILAELPKEEKPEVEEKKQEKDPAPGLLGTPYAIEPRGLRVA